MVNEVNHTNTHNNNIVPSTQYGCIYSMLKSQPENVGELFSLNKQHGQILSPG